jgi:hypothetical protein
MTEPMRRFTILALLCLSLFAAGALPAAGARSHTVKGAGTAEIETPVRFEFEATGTPRRASGRIKYEEPVNQLKLTADVTCLAVDGKTARLTGKLRRPIAIGNTTFTHVQIEVVDDSPELGTPQDFISVTADDAPIPCGRGQDVALFPLTSGKIRVR